MMIVSRLEDYNGKGLLDRGADTLLWPVRYTLNGKSVVVVDRRPEDIDGKAQPPRFEFTHSNAFEKRSYLKTAFAVTLFIPSLFLGAIAKLGVYISSSHFCERYNAFLKSDSQPHDRTTKHVYIVANTSAKDFVPAIQAHLSRRFPNAEVIDLNYKKGQKINPQQKENAKLFQLHKLSSSGAYVFRPEGLYPSEDFNQVVDFDKTLIEIDDRNQFPDTFTLLRVASYRVYNLKMHFEVFHPDVWR